MPLDLHAHPKAELHVHLEGSIGADTLREIDGSITQEEFESNTRGSTFADFLRGYIWVVKKLTRPEHYAIATRRLIQALAEQNVRYAEVTLSAGVVLWKEQSLPAVYDAIWRECSGASVPIRWILDAVRQFGAEAARPVVEFAASRRGDGVLAFGIGGDEIRGPAECFRDVFAEARNAGLHLVAHAGETAGPESIRAALDIGAERIGHGIAAANDPNLMRLLRERNIPLEICVTSNVCTGAVESLEQHPVRTLFEAGVPVTINSDDPALFRSTLTEEYALLRDRFGFGDVDLEQIVENGWRYAFERPESRNRLPHLPLQ